MMYGYPAQIVWQILVQNPKYPLILKLCCSLITEFYFLMSECYSSYTLQLLLDLFLLKVCSLLLFSPLMPFHPLLEDALKTARSRHFLEDIIDPRDKLLSCCKLLSSYLLLQVSEH